MDGNWVFLTAAQPRNTYLQKNEAAIYKGSIRNSCDPSHVTLTVNRARRDEGKSVAACRSRVASGRVGRSAREDSQWWRQRSIHSTTARPTEKLQ
jgi:hypothetical protein